MMLPILLVALATAVPSDAALLPFESTLAFRIDVNGEDHGYFVTGSGAGVATVNGSGGGPLLASLTVPASAAEATGIYPYSDPESFPIHGVVIDAYNGAGAFAGTPLGGTMELRGTAKFCLFGDCSAALANVAVPLSLVGRAGTHALSAALPMTVVGAPWTTATVGHGFTTTMGSVHGPASAASTAAKPGGVVSLVTPTYISSNAGSILMLTRLTLEFVPEPGTLLLFGSGLAALVSVARRRSRAVARADD